MQGTTYMTRRHKMPSPPTPPRLLYVSDPSGIASSVLPDPVEPDDLRRWVDMLADGGVDTLAQDSYSQGMTVYWRSDRFQYDLREQHQRFVPMLEAGDQPVQVLIDRCHQRGMAFIGGARMNDTHDYPAYADFIESHPQWQLPPAEGISWGGKPLDYTFDEVRDFVFQVMQEIVDNFDVDGLELTFRGPAFFPVPHGPERAPLMTDLMRRLSSLMDERSAARGRRLLLGVRVFSSLDQCLDLGIDVPTWIAEGLIDYVSPQDAMYSDFNAPYAEFGALTRNNHCRLYPGMHPWTSYRMRQKDVMTAPMRRALAHTFYGAGADGISFFNHFVGALWRPPFFPQALQIFHELRDPQRVAAGDRHYVFDPTYGGVPWFGVDCNPHGVVHAQRVTLDRGATQPSGLFHFRLYEQMDAVHCATLLVRGANLTAQDELEVKLNDTPLSPGPIGRPDARARERCPDTRWFLLTQTAPAYGENELTITLNVGDPQTSGDLVLDEVEVWVQPTPAISE